jgi:hypothetical protein
MNGSNGSTGSGWLVNGVLVGDSYMSERPSSSESKLLPNVPKLSRKNIFFLFDHLFMFILIVLSKIGDGVLFTWFTRKRLLSSVLFVAGIIKINE